MFGHKQYMSSSGFMFTCLRDNQQQHISPACDNMNAPKTYINNLRSLEKSPNMEVTQVNVSTHAKASDIM